MFHKNIGLLSIDIDGNDYWVWKAITTIDPSIVVIEYNSILGSSKNYTVPYSKNFERNRAHYSNLYYGAFTCFSKVRKRKRLCFSNL